MRPNKILDTAIADAIRLRTALADLAAVEVRASTAEAALTKVREAVGSQHSWGCRRDMSGSGPCDCVNGKVRAAAALVVGDET